MQPSLWQPPVELSEQEEQIMKRIRKAKLFLFLRQHRYELLDEACQEELASLYRKTERGQPPVAPCTWRRCSLSQRYLCPVPFESAMHHQRQRAQCQHPL
jgi:hypothetical protein